MLYFKGIQILRYTLALERVSLRGHQSNKLAQTSLAEVTKLFTI